MDEKEEQGQEPTFQEAVAEEFSGGKSPEEGKETSPEEGEKEEKEEGEEAAAGEKVEEETKEDEKQEGWDAQAKKLEEKIEAQQKELEELKKEGKEAEEKKFVPEEPSDEVKEYFDGDPVAKEAIEHVMRNGVGQAMAEIFGSSDVNELKQQVTDMISFLDETNYAINFEAVILGGYHDEKGEFVEGHSDAKKISQSKEWKEWYEAKVEKDSSFGQNVTPQRGIQIISEFKEDMAKKAAKEHDKEAKAKAKKTKEAIEEPVKPGKTGGAPSAKSKEDDYHGGIDEFLQTS
jgi:hypothetical protein